MEGCPQAREMRLLVSSVGVVLRLRGPAKVTLRMGQRLSEPEHPTRGAPDPPQWAQRLQTAGPLPHPTLPCSDWAGQKWPQPASQVLLVNQGASLFNKVDL